MVSVKTIDEVTSYIEINAKKYLDKRIDYEQRKSHFKANGGSWNPSKKLTLDDLLSGEGFTSTSPEKNITITDGDFIHARESVSPDKKRWDATPQAVSDEIQRRFEGHSVTTASPIEPIASADGYPDVMVDWARPVKPDTSLNNSPTGIAELQENIIDKNEKLKKLIKANEDILAQIRYLTQQMEENLDAIKGIYHGVK